MMKKKSLIKGDFYNKEEKIKKAVAQMLHNNKLGQKKTLKDH